MLYMYSVKPSDTVTTLKSANANPVVINRGSASQAQNSRQPSFGVDSRKQQQSPPSSPATTTFQTTRFQPTTQLSTEARPSEIEITKAPVPRRRKQHFSSTAPPFVLTTGSALREEETTEPFVLAGSSGGFSPLRARNDQPVLQSQPLRPHSQRPPPQPQGFSPPSLRSSPQPQGFSPESLRSPQQPQGFFPPPQRSPPQPQGLSAPIHRSPPQPQGFSPPTQRFPPQPQGFSPPTQRFPPQPQGFSPPNQRFPPQPQGFSPPPLAPQSQFAPQQPKIDLQLPLSPPQPSLVNQQQEQPLPKKLKVRVRKPAAGNVTFPVLHDDASINNPQALNEALNPPKKVAPTSLFSGEARPQFPRNSPLSAFEGVQIAQESGLKHSTIHSKFPSLTFNIPGALFLGSSTKIFKPKPIPSRNPAASTINPFLVPVTTVPPSVENAPRYVRLLNRYSLLESPSGESNFPESAERPGLIINSAPQSASGLSQAPEKLPQAPSARNFNNPAGAVLPSSRVNQQETTPPAAVSLIFNNRRQPQTNQKVQLLVEEDSQLSNSDEVTAINAVFERQTNLRRTQPSSTISQTTFTTPVSAEEQSFKKIAHNEPSVTPKLDSVSLPEQQQRLIFTPVTESNAFVTQNSEIGKTKTVQVQFSKQRQSRFQTGATPSVSFPSTTLTSTESAANNLSPVNLGFQSRKLFLNAAPTQQPIETFTVNPLSTSNGTKAVHQRGRSRYQTNPENKNHESGQAQNPNNSKNQVSGISSRGGRILATTAAGTRQSQSQQQSILTTQSTPSVIQVSPRSSASPRTKFQASSFETSSPSNTGFSVSNSGQSTLFVGRGRSQSTTQATNLLLNQTSETAAPSKFPLRRRKTFSTSHNAPQVTPSSTFGLGDTNLDGQSNLNSGPNEITTQSGLQQERSTQTSLLHHRRRFASSTPTASHVESVATITSSAPILTNSSNKRENHFKQRGLFSKQGTRNTFSNHNSDAQSPDTGFESSNESVRIVATESKDSDTDATIDTNASIATTSGPLLPETTPEQGPIRRKFNQRKPFSFSGQQSNSSTSVNSPTKNETKSVIGQKRGKISSNKSTPIIQQQQSSKPKQRNASFRRTSASPGHNTIKGQTEVTQPSTTNPPRFKPRPLAKSRLFSQTAPALATTTASNLDETATIVNENDVSNSTETDPNASVSTSTTTTTTEPPVTEFRKFKPRTGFPRFQDSVSKRITTSIPSFAATVSSGSKVHIVSETNSSSNASSKSSKRFKPRPITQRFGATEAPIQSITTLSQATSSPHSLILQSTTQPAPQIPQRLFKTRTGSFHRGTPAHQSDATTPVSISQSTAHTTDTLSLSTETVDINSQSGTDHAFGGKRRRRPFGGAVNIKKSVPTLKHDESTPSIFSNPGFTPVTPSSTISVFTTIESATVANSQDSDYLRVSQENTSPDGPRKRRKLKRRKVSQRSTPSDQRGADSNIHAVLTNFTTSEAGTTLSSLPSSVFSTDAASTTPVITTFHRTPEATTVALVVPVAVSTSQATPQITTFRTTPVITTFHRSAVDITTFRATPTVTTQTSSTAHIVTTPTTITKKPVFKTSTASNTTSVKSSSPSTTTNTESTTRTTIAEQKDTLQVNKNKPLPTNKLREISKSKLLAAISAQQRLALEDLSDPDREILAMEADESGDAAGIWFSEPDAGTDAIGSGSSIQRRESGGGSSESDTQSEKRDQSAMENSSIVKSDGQSSASLNNGNSKMDDGNAWISRDESNSDGTSPRKTTVNMDVTESQPSAVLESHTIISISQESEESTATSPPEITTTEEATPKNVQKSRSASFSVSSSTSVQKEISKSSSSNRPSNEDSEGDSNVEKGPPTLIIIDKVGLTNDDSMSSPSIRGRGRGSGGSSSSHEVEIEVTTVPSDKTKSGSLENDASTHRPHRNRALPVARSDKNKQEKNEEEKPRTSGIIGRGANRDRLPKSNARRNQQRAETSTAKPETFDEILETTTTTTTTESLTSPATNADEVKVKSPFDEVGYFGEEEVAPSAHGALDGPLDSELESGALDGTDGGEVPPGGTVEEEVANAGVAEHTDPNDHGHKSEPATGSDDSSSWDLSSLRESPSFNIEVRSRAPKSIQLAARREAKSTGSGVSEDDEVRFLDDRIEPQKKMRTILKLIELKSRFSAERNSPRQIKSPSSASAEVEAFLDTLDRDREDEIVEKTLIGLGKYAYDPSEEKKAVENSTKGAAEFFKLLMATASPLAAEQQNRATLKSNSNNTTNDIDVLLGGPANCSRSDRNICPTSEGYPRELVESIVNKHGAEIQRLWSELQVDSMPDQLYPEDSERQKADLSVCDSVVEALRPGWARDAISGNWMLIVNTEHYPQMVRVESCLRPKKECLFISPYYKSLCVEHRSTQRLVAIRPDQPESGPVIGIFKMPCGCSCQIEMLHGASANN